MSTTRPAAGVGSPPVSEASRRAGAALKADVLAGLPGAIGSVPDGMAASVLAGVSPIHGLYASFAGPVAGGLSTSTRLMVITTTSAAALAAGSALEDVDPASRPGALFLLTLMAGGTMIAAGLAAPRSLHPLRQPLGDDRVPDRRRRQHRGRTAPRPHRVRGRGQHLDPEGVGRPHPPEPDRARRAARRHRRARPHRRVEPHAARGARRRRRARRADDRVRPHRSGRRPGPGPGGHPAGRPTAGVAGAGRPSRCRC